MQILFHYAGLLVNSYLKRKRRKPVSVHRCRHFRQLLFPGYLLSGWLEGPVAGLAMFSRMEVSASIFFIR